MNPRPPKAWPPSAAHRPGRWPRRKTAWSERIDDLLAQPGFGDAAIAAYTLHNGRFHQLLAAMSGSDVIVCQIERATTLPFASPNVVGGAGVRARGSFVIAQGQHRAVIQALEQREGARAEGVMREHTRFARDNLRVAMASHQGLRAMPGQALIRRSALRDGAEYRRPRQKYTPHRTGDTP